MVLSDNDRNCIPFDLIFPIKNLSSGGEYKFDTGTFTPTETTQIPQIEDATIYEAGEVKHNLGAIPSVVYIWTDDEISGNTNIALAIGQCYGQEYYEDEDLPERGWYVPLLFGGLLTNANTINFKADISTANGIVTNKETFVLPNDSTRKYVADAVYHWIAIDLGLTKPANAPMLMMAPRRRQTLSEEE